MIKTPNEKIVYLFKKSKFVVYCYLRIDNLYIFMGRENQIIKNIFALI